MKIFGADPLVWTIRIVICLLLNLLPRSVLKKDRLRFTIALDFITLFSAMITRGLLLAVPVAFLLMLFHLWIRAIGKKPTTRNRTLFVITLVVCGLFIASQIIHLPIRIALKQEGLLIAANVTGLLFAIAMTINGVEFSSLKGFWRKKRKPRTELQYDPDRRDFQGW